MGGPATASRPASRRSVDPIEFLAAIAAVSSPILIVQLSILLGPRMGILLSLLILVPLFFIFRAALRSRRAHASS